MTRTKLFNTLISTISLLSITLPSSGHKLLRGTLPIPDHDKETSSSNILPFGTNWFATDIYINGKLEPTRSPVSLSFIEEEYSLRAFAGCNEISGDLLQVTSTKFHVGDMETSLMYCDEDGIMEQERAFVNIIGQSTVMYEISSNDKPGEDDQVLILWDDEGTQMARLASQQIVTVHFDGHILPVGSNWELKTLAGVDDPIHTDDPITLFIESETSVTGFAGCNGFNGDMELLPNDFDSPEWYLNRQLSISRLITNRRRCEDDVMQQERRLMSVLRHKSLIYSIDVISRQPHEEELSLYSVDIDNGQQVQGELLAQFTWRRDPIAFSSSSEDFPREPDYFRGIEGSNWEVLELDIDGRMEQTVKPITLSFGYEDGFVINTLSGRSGCNSFNSRYELLAGINFPSAFTVVDNLVSTRKLCGDNVMKQEYSFMQLLRHDAIHYQMSSDGETLTLHDVDTDGGRSVQGRLMARLRRTSSW